MWANCNVYFYVGAAAACVMAWEYAVECVNRPAEVRALVDLLQCPLSWGEAVKVVALGMGGLVAVGVAGWVWCRCRARSGARFRPLVGSSPILRRVGSLGGGRGEATREEQEVTGSTLLLESGGLQVLLIMNPWFMGEKMFKNNCAYIIIGWVN